MKAATLIAAGMAVLPSLVAAHANAVPGAPSVFGRRDLNDLRSLKKRHPHRAAKRRASPTGEDLPSKVKPRQASNTDGPCGAGVGSCATGYCCSPAVRTLVFGLTRPNSTGMVWNHRRLLLCPSVSIQLRERLRHQPGPARAGDVQRRPYPRRICSVRRCRHL
jgi:hypothetical protein